MNGSDDLSIKEKLISVLLLKGDRINRTDFFVLAVPLIFVAVTFFLLNDYAGTYFWTVKGQEFVSQDAKSQAINQYRLLRNSLEKVSLVIHLITGFYLVSLMSKRLHDMEKSGNLAWFIILAVAAIFYKAFLVLVVFFFMMISFGIFAAFTLIFAWAIYIMALILLVQMFLRPGAKGENKYGEYFEIFPNPLRKIIGDKIKFFS